MSTTIELSDEAEKINSDLKVLRDLKRMIRVSISMSELLTQEESMEVFMWFFKNNTLLKINTAISNLKEKLSFLAARNAVFN